MLPLLFILIACLAGFLFLLPYWLISVNPFPEPSGNWKVGASDLIWYLPNQPGIMAKIWYPCSTEQRSTSPYIDHLDRTLSSMTTKLHPLFKWILNRFDLGRIQAPLSINAALDLSQNNFPLILLSPGLGGASFLYTFYAFEFASHGFIVVGINHPGWSAGTLCLDGSHIALNSLDFRDVDRADRQFSEITKEKANNLSAVLNEMLKLNATADSWLYQKIDATQIFAVGHSSGGSASFLACASDPRIIKSVNLDGFLYMEGFDVDAMGNEFLLILSNRDKYTLQSKTSQNSFDSVMAKDKIRIDRFSDHSNVHMQVLYSASHLNFTDLPLLFNAVLSKRFGLFGEGDEFDLLLRTSENMIDFFNERA